MYSLHNAVPKEEYQRAITRIISSFFLAVGYCLYVIGIAAPAWRREIGYVHGLWVRCDEGICTHYFTGFSGFLSLVRCGVVMSLLALTTAMICLLLETTMKSAQIANRHTARIAKVLSVTAAIGEVLAAASLAIYGCKFVVGQKTLPVLCWGFAVTGISVIILLLGSILRAMGPPVTWGQDACCLAPARKRRDNLSSLLNASSSMSAKSEICQSHRGTVTDNAELGLANAKKVKKKVGLVSCFHKNKHGYIYSSIPSTRSNSLEAGYRHYEELNFDDMPPPPMELLISLPPVNPSHSFDQESLPAYPDVQQNLHDFSVDQHHRPVSPAETMSQSRQNQHAVKTSEANVQPAPQIHQHKASSQAARRQLQSSASTSRRVRGQATRSPRNHPPITPRHTLKTRPHAISSNPKPQRMKPRSQTAESIEARAFDRTHNAADEAGTSRYQTMPVRTTRTVVEGAQNNRKTKQNPRSHQNYQNRP